MLKESECLEIFSGIKTTKEETVYQKLSNVRKKFLDLQKIYLEFVEGDNMASNVSQEGLQLIKECVSMLNQMQTEEMIDIENEVLKFTMKEIEKKHI